MFVLGLALTGVISSFAGPTGTTTQASGFSSGGPKQAFTYDGDTISAAAFGQPWTGGSNAASQSGWVRTPLSLDCEGGTLALTAKVGVDAMTVTGKTASFSAPGGAVIVGVLWKSGRAASVTGATWAEDGSAATVTLSKEWGSSRVFYCTPTPTTSGPTMTEPTGSGPTGTDPVVTDPVVTDPTGTLPLGTLPAG
jgi:hypothetical protein